MPSVWRQICRSNRTRHAHILKQVFEYDEVMNNWRRAVYSERLRVLDGRALKKQVIGYGERTMAEIVEAYVNLDLPLEEWDLEQLVGKVKEFIHLLEDITPDQGPGPRYGGIQVFPQEQLQPTTSKKVRSNNSARV